MVRNGIKKKWKLLAVQIITPVFLSAMLLGILNVYANYDHAKSLERIYATKIQKLPAPIYNYESERFFNGDGYSLTVYPLPKVIKNRFQKADKLLLTKYPKFPYKEGWQIVKWHKSPIDSKYKNYLSFAIISDGSPGMENHLQAIERSLSRPGSFYSFVYKGSSFIHKEVEVGLLDIDFFVIDLQQDKIYHINNNT
ncbi:MAG: hypothetical protein ACKPBB_10295 [Sphaerospermopsis kisseleviana]